MKRVTEGNKGKCTSEQKFLPWDHYLISPLSLSLLLSSSCDALVLSSRRISNNQGFVQPMMSFLVLLLVCLFLIVGVNRFKQL